LDAFCSANRAWVAQSL